jgi:hypothetical protein
MATQFVSVSAMSDAALQGTVVDAFRTSIDENEKLWKSTLGFEESETTKPFEEYENWAGIGSAPPRREGEQFVTDTPKQGFRLRISQLEYGIMIPISESTWRFVKRGEKNLREVMKPAEMVAESMAVTNEILASDIYGNAFSASFTGPDGVSLVSNAHVLIRGGTDSNYLGAVSFSQSSLEAAIVQGDRMKEDTGLQRGVKPGKRRLVIPNEYQFEAKRILESTGQSNTANNAINALKDEGLMPAKNRWLPSTTNWFIRNMGETNTLHAIFETKPKVDSFGDDKLHMRYFRCYQMCAFAFGLNWRGVQGSDF